VSALTFDQAQVALAEIGDLGLTADECNEKLWTARCPLCAAATVGTEKRPLSIVETKRDGPVRIECRNGCDRAEILRRLLAALPSEDSTGRVVAESFARVRTEQTRWLWAGRIPLRAPSLLVGREKLGKSTLTVELAARLSRGRLPGDLAGHPSSVLLLSYEDSPGSTIKPRLLAAGADPALIFQATAQRDGLRDLVSLPDDVDNIAAIVQEHKCRLVIVDPFSASLSGDVNSHRDQDIRRAIASLAQLAEVEDAALLLVAHFNKAAGGDSLTRVLGSRGLTAASRSVLVFGRAPDTEDGSPERVLAHAACNLAAEAPSLACRIEPRVIDTEAGIVETSRLVLLGEIDACADDLLAYRSEDERSDREIAADWLEDELADGEWRKAAEIKAGAKADGIAERTLHRARVQLGVEDRREGFPPVGEWRLAFVPTPAGTNGATEVGANGQTRMVEPNPTHREAHTCQVSDNGTIDWGAAVRALDDLPDDEAREAAYARLERPAATS
jgi:hypothetical protein